VFDTDPGAAVIVALSDIRDRFRLVASVVAVVPLRDPLPKVARRPRLGKQAGLFRKRGGLATAARELTFPSLSETLIKFFLDTPNASANN
jgi:L-arabinose isomerase